MIYFNGFSLKGEEIFFKDQLIEGDFTVAGFSYGAQRAFEYAYQSDERIDRLILLSPAFFQDKKKSFVRTQLRYFKGDQATYIKNFIANVAHPSSSELTSYLDAGSEDELNALLTYQWEKDKLLALINRGVTIEVFMGSEDKIVDAQKSYDFFSALTTVYFQKEVGHLLH